jgi:poly(hydroxyalkanoate) depolymerase family esterase
MNQTFTSKLPHFDIESITSTIERALSSAGLQTTTGPMQGVTETIRRALSSAGMQGASDPKPASRTDSTVIDVVAREVETPAAGALPSCSTPGGGAAAPGAFTTHHFRNHAGARSYKLFVPATLPSTPVPLVVMLHGCTQSADDFAAGTQMNRLAEDHGFIVVYPEQAPNANGSKCWNWFKAQDQLRDSGEPSLIAGITREVAERHAVDPRRIYVAGLSAGASMAVILGETYPELFAAVGAHSGLPYAAAHDMPSAFAAMASGSARMPDMSKLPGLADLPGSAAGATKKATHFVPTIVFHGDEDHTVAQGNGAKIIEQAINALAGEAHSEVLSPSTQRGVSPRGRAYSRTVYADKIGQPRVESWVLHGAGHAWSGGHASGSFTDGSGSDASAEMVRFFLAQPAAGSYSP